MKHNVLFYNSETDKTFFQLQSGTRPWGILMLITAGRYTLELPNTKQTYTLSANTISYIPPNTFFVRKVEEPIHFHQFHIQCQANDLLMNHVHAGILPITTEQICAISSQCAIPKYSEDISCVLQYMEEHRAEDLKLITLAEIADLSPTGLIWKFHQQLNTTPQRHFIQLRIQYAKQLLVETSLPITQIAEKCGYNDVYYFSNAFRKNTGVSPSAFRISPRI